MPFARIALRHNQIARDGVLGRGYGRQGGVVEPWCSSDRGEAISAVLGVPARKICFHCVTTPEAYSVVVGAELRLVSTFLGCTHASQPLERSSLPSSKR